MGSILRFLALAGVISAGSYMLYQAETRLSETESTTQSESSDNAPVSLGAASGDGIPSLGENAPQQFEPEPSSLVVEVPDDSSGLNFNDATVTTADGSMSADDPFGAVRLASDEVPVELNPARTSADEFPALEPRSSENPSVDPFGEEPADPKADPFGEFAPLESADKKNDAGPALNLPLPEEFPALEKQKTETPDPFGESAPELPEPATLDKPEAELDPFAPLPSATKPEKPTALEAPATSADPFGESPTPREPNPFGEADKFEDIKVRDAASNDQEFYPIITPLRSSPKTTETRTDSFALPKITPKPKVQPAPFESDEQLPKVGSEPGLPSTEADPFAEEPPKTSISPASAENSLPLITPKKKVLESDPFSSEPPERTGPVKFPQPLEPKPSPEPKELEEAFPLPEPLPSRPLGESADIKKPTPAADAFPSLDAQPAVETPVEADPFGESEKTVQTNETPVDDSFTFPPLPKATPADTPAPLKTEEEAFPSLDPIVRTPVDEKPAPSEFETKPFPDSPLSDSENPLTELKGLPEFPAEPELTDVKQPSAPKELSESGISKPIKPRAVPLPQLVIEKLAPEKAVLKQPFVYHILIKNTGTAPVAQVTVQDQVPRGTKLTGTIPQAELTGERLVWKLDRMQPGEEKKISIRVIPEQAGPIGSVATVNYVAEVGSETVIELPKIDFRMVLPPDARVGEVVTCRFDIENKGDQTITGLILRDILPEGLYHPSGQDLENPLGDLKPGDRIIEQLQLKIVKTGEIVNTAYLGAEGGLRLEATARLNAKSSTLTITRRGPQRRVVGSPAIYHNVVKNVSDKPVSDALVVEQLPQGMEFVSASADGEFHDKGRTIFWKLPTLQPGQSIVLQSKVIP
ncbi:MAG TPA: hypothetical protein VLA12_17920, partial [Planctomycetaceae bacterium]|nr:hypothetical protein [Planctomycetaceae bacterium]